MKKIKIFSLIVLLSFLFNQSCNYSKSTLPYSLGKTLELLVVTNNKEQWNGRMGDAIREHFEQLFPGLPQDEPLFQIFYLPQEAFGNLHKPNHLIFIGNIDSKLKEPLVENKKDLWAKPQRVIKISAPDIESFLKVFDEKKDGITQLYQELSRERIINFFKTAQERKTIETLRKSFHINMVFPSGFNVAKRVEDNFIWIRKETNRFSQGIFIYTYDYTSTNAFDLQKIIARRNILTKTHVPGPLDNTYMKVADEVVAPVVKKLTFNDMYAVEVRGLWEVEGDFMGGPFLSYTFVDEKNNKVITLDSYVYAPHDKKRIYMKEMEAIMYSFKLLAPEDTTN